MPGTQICVPGTLPKRRYIAAARQKKKGGVRWLRQRGGKSDPGRASLYFLQLI